MKIMKEIAWINRKFFLNLAFGQVGEKNLGKDWFNSFSASEIWLDKRGGVGDLIRRKLLYANMSGG